MYPPEVLDALKEALRSIYHFKRDLRTFFENCEIPAHIIQKQRWDDPDEYKVYIAEPLRPVFRDQHTHLLDDFEKLKEINEAAGGFFSIHWCGAELCEDRLQEETKATIRAIPLDGEVEAGRCILCGGDSERRVVAARAY